MLSTKLLERNGINNHIVEAISLNVFYKLSYIVRKQNPHSLVGLGLGGQCGGKDSLRASESALNLW